MIQVTRQGRGPRMLGMMGVILGSAIGFGAIRSPSMFGAQAVVVSTLATLLVAIFGAILCKPKAFWFGLASVGWASMLLASSFWFEPIEGEPNLLGAAIFWRYYPREFVAFSRRFEFGEPQLRAIVFSQVALVQGLVGGFAVFLLKREHMPSIRRFGNRLQVNLWIVLAIATTYLALRFCDTIGSIVYVQVVTILLVALTIGIFVGRHRSACAGAALLGWATLLWDVYGPPNLSDGLAAKLYEAIYPHISVYNGFADPRPGSWDAWRSWLFGDSADLRMLRLGSTRWGRWKPEHFRRFILVADHAAALIALFIGAVMATWIERRTRTVSAK